MILLLQSVDIEEKLKNAPNDDYGIGIFIGNMIPFVVLVVIAYTIFWFNKKRINKQKDGNS